MKLSIFSVPAFVMLVADQAISNWLFLLLVGVPACVTVGGLGWLVAGNFIVASGVSVLVMIWYAILCVQSSWRLRTEFGAWPYYCSYRLSWGMRLFNGKR